MLQNTNMRISAMAALDSKRAIGKNNDLLFKIPEDFARMKRITSGHPIIMGRKTFESIGHPLPNRTNIVITRDPNYHAEGITVVHTLDEAVEKANEIEEKRVSAHPIIPDLTQNDNPEVFIFGGGQIFQEAMPIIDRIYLTLVEGDYSGDVFFPEYSAFNKILEKESKEAEGYRYTFLTLEK